ncbi:unnamed protein product, partial [Sphacelaria rigidula]
MLVSPAEVLTSEGTAVQTLSVLLLAGTSTTCHVGNRQQPHLAEIWGCAVCTCVLVRRYVRFCYDCFRRETALASPRRVWSFAISEGWGLLWTRSFSNGTPYGAVTVDCSVTVVS